MKNRSPAGSSVTCDFPGCTQRFATVSDASVIRVQAQQSGWAFVSGKTIRDHKHMAISSKKVDVCPLHKPKERTI